MSSTKAEEIANAHDACINVLGQRVFDAMIVAHFPLPRIARIAAHQLFMKMTPSSTMDYMGIWRYLKELGD